MMTWLLHEILPSTFWGWVGSTTFILAATALGLYLSGMSKLVEGVADVAEAALQPVAGEAGKLAAGGIDNAVMWTEKGLTGICTNPVVLWPMLIFLAVSVPYGVSHFTAQSNAAVKTATIAEKAATTKLSACLAQQKKPAAKPKAIIRHTTPSKSSLF